MSELPYPLVIFDLDGTLLNHTEPVWKTLHRLCGSDPVRRRQVVAAGLSGQISYAEWFAADLEMLKAVTATKAQVLDVAKQMQPQRGCVALLDALRPIWDPYHALRVHWEWSE